MDIIDGYAHQFREPHVIALYGQLQCYIPPAGIIAGEMFSHMRLPPEIVVRDYRSQNHSCCHLHIDFFYIVEYLFIHYINSFILSCNLYYKPELYSQFYRHKRGCFMTTVPVHMSY